MDTDVNPAEMAASSESAHTTSRKSAPTLRMDLIPRGERRRRWTTEQKQTIAAQSLVPGVSPPDVARLHGIRTGQLYTWRHALKAAQPGAAIGRFALVEVMPQPVAPPDVLARPPGLLEIALSDGTTLARNIDAVASRAGAAGKDYRLLICHEHALKYHETLLLTGYRSGAWLGGLPMYRWHNARILPYGSVLSPGPL